MKKAIDITGKKFGYLTAIKINNIHTKPSGQKVTRWLCQCECGKQVVVASYDLRNGHTKSCGCKKGRLITESKIKHNFSKKPIYRVLNSIKQRCNNPKNHAYKNYGARGIKVCDEWSEGFEKFYQWAINNGYKKGLSIDRVDVNGNYEPSNCRWATRKEQARNKRNNHLITYNSETYCLTDWAIKKNLSISTIFHRLKRGWSIEKTLNAPIKKTKKVS